MRIFRLFALAALVGAATAPTYAATRGFAVGPFDRVRSSVPFDVRVRSGATPAVRASGPQEILDRLQISVSGGELIIGMRRGSWFSSNWRGERGVIEVAGPALVGATLSGPGNIAVDQVRGPRFVALLDGPGNLTLGSVAVRQLDATLNGPGDLTAAGRVERATLVLRGPGNIRAAGLTARDATVTLSGPGNIAATVTGHVQGMLSGPGDVTIQGGARCDIAKHGPGDVRCR